MSTFDEAALYAGVAEEAKRLAAVAAAHRTGRGEWYAVVELARASRDHPHVWEHITSAQEKCSSRAAAVEAGRRLMAEKADWVGPDAEISVNIRSALEWRPEEWE